MTAANDVSDFVPSLASSKSLNESISSVRTSETPTPETSASMRSAGTGLVLDRSGEHPPISGNLIPRLLSTISNYHALGIGAGIAGLTSAAGQNPFRIISLGDINRDGYGDYGVSVEVSSGNVGIVFGGATPGSIAASGFTSLVTGVGSQYIGHGLTGAGDLNDDGTVDMVAGSIESFLVVILLRAGGTLLSSHVLDSASPCMPGGITSIMRCGIGMGLLGRLDGDRYNEILMGCDNAGGADVAAFTIFMGKGGVALGHGATLGSSPLLSPLSASHSGFGFSVTGVGDLDGDGLVDAAYGANIDDSNFANTGTVVIGFMHLNGTLREAKFINKNSGGATVQAHLSTFLSDWRLAEHLSGCGDVDGDGVPDLLVGSAKAGSPSSSGRVEVMFLNTDGTVKAVTGYGKNLGGLNTHINLLSNARFGLSVFSAGDFTGTGKFTFGSLVGGQAGASADAAGSLVFVTLDEGIPTNTPPWAQQLANDPPLVKSARPITAAPATAFADSTAFRALRSAVLGDLNADGFFDIVLADWTIDEIFVMMGQAGGQFGAATTTHIPPNHANFVSPPSTHSINFGQSILPAGDVNLDGVPDMYAGGPGAMSGAPTGSGSLWLLLLNPDGSLQKGFEMYEGLPAKIAGSECGYGLGALGDNNEDGFLEVLVGCAVTGGEAFAYLFYMGLNGVVGRSVVHTTVGNPDFGSLSQFGYAFAGMGDLDGNGHLDYASLVHGADKIAVAFLNVDGTLSHFVVTGAASGTLANIAEVAGAEPLAHNFAAAGDLNGDGVRDILLGGSNRPANGAFYILFMKANGTVLGGHRFQDSFEGFAAAYPAVSTGGGWGASLLWLGDYMETGNATLLVAAELSVTARPPLLLDLALPAIELSEHKQPVQLVDVGLPSNRSVAPPLDAFAVPRFGPNFTLTGTLESGSVPGFAALQVRLFGSAMGPVGDINSDGTIDVVVGVPNEDMGEGALVIVYMGVNGLPLLTPAPLVVDSFTDTEGVGACVCAHGGLSATRHVGLVFGAPFYDSGKGRVRFWAVNSNGSPVGGQHSVTGAAANMRLGTSCAVLGDVNGDGRADIALGARGSAGVLEGSVHVQKTGLYGVSLGTQVINGPSATGQELSEFGTSLAALGDVDGNDIPDGAVGEVKSDFGGVTNGGSITILFLAFGGSEASRVVLGSGTTPNPLFAVRPRSSLELGESLGAAGDVNGDGTIDLLVGDPLAAVQRGGFDLLLMGRGSAGQVVGATSLRRSFPGGVPDVHFSENGRLGQAVTGLGDSNDDGFLDFGVARSSTGERLLFLGSAFKRSPGHCPGALRLAQTMCSKEDFALAYDTHSTVAHVNFTQQSGQHNGFGIALIGDVDGNGYVDFVQGVTRWEVTTGVYVGRVYVFSTGASFAVQQVTHIDLESVGTGSDFVSGVAAIGDVNADGVPDVMVGSAWLDSNRGGFSILLLDALGAAETTTTYRSAAPPVGTLAASQFCGRAVAGLGDITGDAHMDVIVGCPGTAAVEASVIVLSLGVGGSALTSALSPSPVAPTGVPAFSGFGYSIATLGDLDGDGLVEVAAGCPFAAAAGGSITSAGGLAIVSVLANMSMGHAVFLPASVAGRGQAETNGMFGSGMTFVGHLDGSGFPQLMVHTRNPGMFQLGSLELLTLTPQRSVRVASRLDKFFGNMPLAVFGAGAQFGTGLAAVGNADATGQMTFLVGNPHSVASYIVQLRTTQTVPADYCAPALQIAGACVEYPVSNLTISAVGTSSHLFPSRAAGDGLGASVAVIGDLNADGLVDFAAGAPGSGSGAGGVYVIFGQGAGMALSTTALTAQLITGISLDATAGGVGASVAAAGDLNDDGTLDIFVG